MSILFKSFAFLKFSDNVYTIDKIYNLLTFCWVIIVLLHLFFTGVVTEFRGLARGRARWVFFLSFLYHVTWNWSRRRSRYRTTTVGLYQPELHY